MEKGEKKERILEYLRHGIAAGEWTGKVLPGEVELAEKFGFARATVRRAYAQLVSEGFLERRKHRGTVLCGGYQEKYVIGAVMRCRDHFYEDVFRCLKAETSRSQYLLQTVDTYGFNVPKLRKHIRRGITGILHAPISKVILDGLVFNTYPMSRDLLRKQPVIFDYFDGIAPDGTTGVLIDYHAVGRMGAEYLLKRGCRRPLLFCGPLKPRLRFCPETFSRHKDKQLLEGFSEVLRSAGMDPLSHVFLPVTDWKVIDRQLFEIFSSPECRPDGIFASQDVKVVRMLKIAAECGYEPKHRIGVLNTPWSRGEGGHPFPTIAISPEKCASALVEQVLLPPGRRRNVFIQPELIRR